MEEQNMLQAELENAMDKHQATVQEIFDRLLEENAILLEENKNYQRTIFDLKKEIDNLKKEIDNLKKQQETKKRKNRKKKSKKEEDETTEEEELTNKKRKKEEEEKNDRKEEVKEEEIINLEDASLDCCCICLDEFDRSLLTYNNVNTCRHGLCRNCLDNNILITYNITCPMCREELSTEIIQSVPNIDNTYQRQPLPLPDPISNELNKIPFTEGGISYYPDIKAAREFPETITARAPHELNMNQLLRKYYIYYYRGDIKKAVPFTVNLLFNILMDARENLNKNFDPSEITCNYNCVEKTGFVLNSNSDARPVVLFPCQHVLHFSCFKKNAFYNICPKHEHKYRRCDKYIYAYVDVCRSEIFLKKMGDFEADNPIFTVFAMNGRELDAVRSIYIFGPDNSLHWIEQYQPRSYKFHF